MSAELAEPVRRLVDELSRLPGIGRKSAQRLALHLLRGTAEEAGRLVEAIVQVKERIHPCSTCFSYTDRDPCAFCADPGRDRGLICVVQEPGDILAVERGGGYRGLYHVLGGALSPLKGVGPESLRIAELVVRVAGGGAKEAVAEGVEPAGDRSPAYAPVREVILATDPDMEGEATAGYILQELRPTGVKVSRIGFGLPVGGSLEFADEVTMARAMEGRRVLG